MSGRHSAYREDAVFMTDEQDEAIFIYIHRRIYLKPNDTGKLDGWMYDQLSDLHIDFVFSSRPVER